MGWHTQYVSILFWLLYLSGGISIRSTLYLCANIVSKIPKMMLFPSSLHGGAKIHEKVKLEFFFLRIYYLISSNKLFMIHVVLYYIIIEYQNILRRHIIWLFQRFGYAERCLKPRFLKLQNLIFQKISMAINILIVFLYSICFLYLQLKKKDFNWPLSCALVSMGSI